MRLSSLLPSVLLLSAAVLGSALAHRQSQSASGTDSDFDTLNSDQTGTLTAPSKSESNSDSDQTGTDDCPRPLDVSTLTAKVEYSNFGNQGPDEHKALPDDISNMELPRVKDMNERLNGHGGGAGRWPIRVAVEAGEGVDHRRDDTIRMSGLGMTAQGDEISLIISQQPIATGEEVLKFGTGDLIGMRYPYQMPEDWGKDGGKGEVLASVDPSPSPSPNPSVFRYGEPRPGPDGNAGGGGKNKKSNGPAPSMPPRGPDAPLMPPRNERPGFIQGQNIYGKNNKGSGELWAEYHDELGDGRAYNGMHGDLLQFRFPKGYAQPLSFNFVNSATGEPVFIDRPFTLQILDLDGLARHRDDLLPCSETRSGKGKGKGISCKQPMKGAGRAPQVRPKRKLEDEFEDKVMGPKDGDELQHERGLDVADKDEDDQEDYVGDDIGDGSSCFERVVIGGFRSYKAGSAVDVGKAAGFRTSFTSMKSGNKLDAAHDLNDLSKDQAAKMVELTFSGIDRFDLELFAPARSMNITQLASRTDTVPEPAQGVDCHTMLPRNIQFAIIPAAECGDSEPNVARGRSMNDPVCMAPCN